MSERHLWKRLEQHSHHINTWYGTARKQLREGIDSVTEALRWTGVGDELKLQKVGYLSMGALTTSIADYVEGENADG